MPLSSDDFPSSPAFDAIATALANDPAGRAAAIKQTKAIIAIRLRNAAGAERTWHLDLKRTGTVGEGAVPQGQGEDAGDADVTLILSDADFGALVKGKASAQRLFMAGKLKVRGDVMKATKAEPVLKKAGEKAKL